MGEKGGAWKEEKEKILGRSWERRSQSKTPKKANRGKAEIRIRICIHICIRLTQVRHRPAPNQTSKSTYTVGASAPTRTFPRVGFALRARQLVEEVLPRPFNCLFFRACSPPLRGGSPRTKEKAIEGPNLALRALGKRTQKFLGRKPGNKKKTWLGREPSRGKAVYTYTYYVYVYMYIIIYIIIRIIIRTYIRIINVLL